MRMSCNGCRVLRKGCSESCTLRPCLQWINSPESQANATVFLAKFYGRAGLINLINAGPDHLRPAIFKSLLYEACGRIINPVSGSVGLVWSGNWNRCQEAVEAVLNGSTIMQVPINDDTATADQEAANYPITPLKGCDIRHLSKNSSDPIHRVKTRNRFKRSGLHGKSPVADQFMNENDEPAKFSITGWECGDQKMDDDELKRAPSHDSFSVETVEASLANRVDPVKSEEDCEIGLELTLGLVNH